MQEIIYNIASSLDPMIYTYLNETGNGWIEHFKCKM